MSFEVKIFFITAGCNENCFENVGQHFDQPFIGKWRKNQYKYFGGSVFVTFQHPKAVTD